MEEDKPAKTGDNVICCLGCKFMTCKPSKEEGVMCKVLGADCDCVPFRVCCQGRSQMCCLDSRISFPPTKEIPCLVTCCFITCCFDYNCLCTCGDDVESMQLKMERKVGLDSDYEMDDEDGNRRKSEGNGKGNRKKRSGEDDERDYEEKGEWESVIDSNTGKTYYVNTITQKTQWEKPY